MAITYISNASIEDEDCSVITDWANDDVSPFVSSQATFDGKSCFKFYTGASWHVASGRARRIKDVGTLGSRFVVSLNLYCDLIGTLAGVDYFRADVYNGTIKFVVRFCSDGLYIFDGASWMTAGNLVVQDSWQEWTFDVDASTPADANVDIYIGQSLQVSSFDCSHVSGDTNGNCKLSQLGYSNHYQLSYVDWFKVGDAFEGEGWGHSFLGASSPGEALGVSAGSIGSIIGVS